MLLSKTAKRNIILFAAAFLLCGVLHVVLYGCPFTVCFVQLYGGTLVVLWGTTVRKRITDNRLCFILLCIAGCLLLQFILQIFRYDFFYLQITPQRYVWYLMHLPLIAQPVLCFFLELYVYRPKEMPLPKAYWLIPAAAALLVLGILTNDLHFAAFRFPSGILDDNGQEVKNWLYYLSFAFRFSLYVLVLLIIQRKNRRTLSLQNRLLILTPLFIGAGYFLLYPFNIGKLLIGVRIWQMGEMSAFCMIGTLEGCIQAGLIPENRSYEAIFSAAPFPAVILDHEENLIYKTQNVQYPFQTDPDAGIVTHPIKGGYVRYLVDLRPMRELNRELQEQSHRIEARNAYLAEETRIKKERAEVETRNRLYDTISEIVQTRLSRIDQLLESPDGCGTEELARIAVLKAYIKRRSNMELLAEGGHLTVTELSTAVAESLQYVQLLGAGTASGCIGSGAYPAAMIIAAYEQFETVIEESMDTLSDVFVMLRAEGKTLTLRMLLQSDDFSYASDRSLPGSEAFSCRTGIEKNGRDLTIVFTFTEGGGV